jgi:polar amino acid transport system substrate-binding protein
MAAELTVAIQVDTPPYVMKKATTGLEVDVIHAALAGDTVRFVQMPYADLQTVIQRHRADAAAAVQDFPEDTGVVYSRDLFTFENAAVTKKSAGLQIQGVADLASHGVLAWEDAYRELGPAFERQYAPGAPGRKHYVEIGDQAEQAPSSSGSAPRWGTHPTRSCSTRSSRR